MLKRFPTLRVEFCKLFRIHFVQYIPSPTTLFDPVFGLGRACRLPLHVAGFIDTAAFQGLDVIDHVAGAGS
jgi:hypothetical protein